MHVEFCPLSTTATTGALLQTAATKMVREASPKLEFSRKLLPLPKEGAPPSPQLAVLTYVDGHVQTLDLSSIQIRDVLEEIDLQNGRLDAEAMKRGRPWS